MAKLTFKGNDHLNRHTMQASSVHISNVDGSNIIVQSEHSVIDANVDQATPRIP